MSEMFAVIGVVVVGLYLAGFGLMATLIWLMGGGGWKSVPDAVIVGSVWPYMLWEWTR